MNKTCVYCGLANAHHRSSCQIKFKPTITNSYLSGEIANECDQVQENVLISSGEIVLMQTATTKVKNSNNSMAQITRLLLDSGSQRTYIAQKLADRLNLKGESEQELKLVTFGCDKPKLLKTKQTTLCIKLKNGNFLDIVANIVPVISGNVQRGSIKLHSSENFNHLASSLDLADTIPTENETSSVELLIGNDYYLDIILSQKIKVQPGLYLLGSKLGWILTGRTAETDYSPNETSMLILTYGTNITDSKIFTNVDTVYPRKSDLEEFWNVESIGVIDKKITSGDDKAKEIFRDTLKFENGRYQVTWPWKERYPDLPQTMH